MIRTTSVNPFLPVPIVDHRCVDHHPLTVMTWGIDNRSYPGPLVHHRADETTPRHYHMPPLRITIRIIMVVVVAIASTLKCRIYQCPVLVPPILPPTVLVAVTVAVHRPCSPPHHELYHHLGPHPMTMTTVLNTVPKEWRSWHHSRMGRIHKQRPILVCNHDHRVPPPKRST